MKETYRVIPGFVDYLVSDLGNVKSLKFGREKILSQSLSSGYPQVRLSNKNIQPVFKVHRLVAMAFLGYKTGGGNNKDSIVVDHINSVRNDNRLENLQLLTLLENSKKKHSHTLPVGVTYFKRQYIPEVYKNGKRVYLGTYSTIKEAELVYHAYK